MTTWFYVLLIVFNIVLLFYIAKFIKIHIKMHRKKIKAKQNKAYYEHLKEASSNHS